MKPCKDIQTLLSAHLDRELRTADHNEVCVHLETCAACRAEERSILQLKEALRKVQMPSMPREILAMIEAETILKSRWWESPMFQRRWLPVAAGIGATAVAGWLFMKSQMVASRSPELTLAVGISTSPAVAMHQDPDKEPVNEDVH